MIICPGIRFVVLSTSFVGSAAHHDHARPPQPALQIAMTLASLVAILLGCADQSQLLDHETDGGQDRTQQHNTSSRTTRRTHLVPMNTPLPMARHTPTILKLVFALSTSSAAWLDVAADAAAETAADDDIVFHDISRERPLCVRSFNGDDGSSVGRSAEQMSEQ